MQRLSRYGMMQTIRMEASAGLTVTLMKNETVVVQTVTLDAVHNWTAKVENLAKNENGTPIRYSWVEGTMPEGYSLESTAVTDEKNSDDVVIGMILTLTSITRRGKEHR